jgi:hypothetical protein
MPHTKLIEEVTGEGTTFWSDPYDGSDLYVHVEILDFGMAHSSDADEVSRYVDVGWIALVENYGTGGELEGIFYAPLHWITFERSVIRLRDESVAGMDGYHYALKPGVVLRITWKTAVS